MYRFYKLKHQIHIYEVKILSLISLIISFFTSSLPSVFSFLRARQDDTQELAIMQLQVQAQEKLGSMQLQEIQMQASSSEMAALYQNAFQPSGIKWIDALNDLMRPMITVIFLVLYFLLKYPHVKLLFELLGEQQKFRNELAFLEAYDRASANVWSQEDSIIWAGICAFYFGSEMWGRWNRTK